MNILGVIPARYQSKRLPGKPLALIGKKTMVQRVWEQASKATKLTKLIVATDDQRIFDHVQSFGGEAVMTDVNHSSGTDRIVEIAETYTDFEAYINIQGDEPFIDPDAIDLVCDPFFSRNGIFVSTLIKKMEDLSELDQSSIVKVVIAKDSSALYFSRSPIPFFRDAEGKKAWLEEHGYYKHLGIYGYTDRAIQMIRNLSRTGLEKAEQLEQLRWLENGIKVFTNETHTVCFSVDTPEDLEQARKILVTNEL